MRGCGGSLLPLPSSAWVILIVGTVLGCTPPWASRSGPLISDDHALSTVERVGFRIPAAVLHDEAGDVYLVSNVDGPMLAKDGNGFISRVRPTTGHVIDLRWIEGGEGGVELHAPKGMAIRGDTLLVADIDCIRLFDRGEGTPIGSVCPEGAVDLKDLVVDRRGSVFATDRSGVLFAIEPDGSFSEVFRGDELGEPTGLASSVRGVFVAGFDNRSVSQLWPDGLKPFVRGANWQLDGLTITTDGSFAFSNWADSSVLYILAKDGGSKGDIFTLVKGVPTPGELDHDARRDRIIVPVLEEDRLYLIDLFTKDREDDVR